MQGSSKPDRQLLDTAAFWRHLAGVTVKFNSNRRARFGKYRCLNQQSPSLLILRFARYMR